MEQTMPYYIYKITTDEGSSAKQLDLVSEYDNFKTAKQEVRSMRASNLTDGNIVYKVIFAGNQPEAEQRLLAHREQPIVKEWEK
jgi:hypothetical protein